MTPPASAGSNLSLLFFGFSIEPRRASSTDGTLKSGHEQVNIQKINSMSRYIYRRLIQRDAMRSISR